MKSTATTLFLIILSATARSQYYYKDIMGTQETNNMMKLYKASKVRQVSAAGFDGDGRPSSDFSEFQNITGNRLRLSTRNQTEVSIQYFDFDDQSLLKTITDTSASLVAVTSYTYNDKNNVVSIQNTATDADDSIYVNEKHVWVYNGDQKPEKMYRIINKNDTTEVRFTVDENGNVIEEQPFKKGRPGEKIYYYYDAKNRLTDIVRYYDKAKRLLPDFMFEYSDDNRLAQKVTTLSDRGLGYLYWRYFYDDKGLKTKEVTFNRDKAMTGRIEYSYTY